MRRTTGNWANCLFGMMAVGCTHELSAAAPAGHVQTAPAREFHSIVEVPVQINLESYIDQVAQLAPTEIWSPGWRGESDDTGWIYASGRFAPDDNRVRYHVRATKPVDVKMGSNWIELSGDYLARVDAQTREKVPLGFFVGGFCDVPVHATLRISFGLGSDWTTQASREVHVESAPCPIQVLWWGQDLAPQIEQRFADELNTRSAPVLSMTGALDLRTTAAQAWQALSRPSDIGNGFEFAFNPESVSASQPSFIDRSLSIRFAIEGRPEVGVKVQGREKPLPELRFADSGGEWLVELDAAVGYAEVEDVLQLALSNILEVDGRDLRVKVLSVGPGPDGYLVVRLQVEGAFAGSLYVLTRPEVRESSLRLRDVRLAIESSGLLDRVFAPMLEQRLADRLADLRFPINALMSSAKDVASRAINREFAGGKSIGAVTGISVSHIWCGESAVGIRMHVTANVRLEVQSTAPIAALP